jgi:predicted ArsR family transcriptional regulator
MLEEQLNEDLIAVMRLVREKGAAVCAGTCEHRLPGELHCLTAAQILKISAAGFKRRLRKLVTMGFLDRNRVERPDGANVAQYTLNEAGEEELAKHG